MKAGGFLDVKKNGKDLEVDVRGLLDLERWSMLNYLSACFYNLATDPVSYKWYIEDKKNSDSLALYTFFLYATGYNFSSRKKGTYLPHFNRYFLIRFLDMKGFKKIEDFVDSWFNRLLPIKYSDSVKRVLTDKKDALSGHIKLHHVDGKEEHVKYIMNDQGIVHNSNLKVEAKINLADNKLPFNEKFKKEALNALYECIETAYSTDLIGKKKKPVPWEIDGITYSNNGAVEITNKVGKLIEDYDKKRKGYTLTFSDLMSIDELRLLIQGNFEDKVLKKHKWAKDGFKEKNAKELEALIRDTFVFHDIYAVNFLLANKFVQDAFIRVNIPTGFSPLDLGGRFFECLDDRFKSIGRGLYEEWNKNAENPKRVITDTATSMYFFDEIDSLDEKKLVYFLGQEFYKDYKKGETSKFREKISVPATTLSGLSDIELANLYAKILKGDKPSINNQQEKNQALAEIAEGIRNGIRKLLRSVLEDRYKLYYGEGYIESKDARMVIRGTCTNIMSYRNLSLDERQFSEAFDYLGLECETFHLEPKEIKLVRGRKNDKKNGIINMAIDEDDGIMNLQILKILCKKLSVFCAKDENDQKLYLFPYPWDDDLKKCDVGSICDVSDKGIEHISYHYDYEGDSGEDKYGSLPFKFNEKVGIMEPDYTKSKCINGTYKHNLLLKEDVFTDRELMEKGLTRNTSFFLSAKKNPWDRVRNFCSFSNYANVKLRIYDDKLPFIRKETDDVICFDVPNDLKLALFKEKSGGTYESGPDGSIKFISNGGFYIEPATKGNYDNKQ